ncbi:MAG TPA: hypothetical protein DCQ46_00540 [Lachnospiraceae bacterium]|nr:hypothetical protein [Lachnospiraceae bacterium]HBR05182.1 hypothetical protein [Lachnospiraceae bacterium]
MKNNKVIKALWMFLRLTDAYKGAILFYFAAIIILVIDAICLAQSPDEEALHSMLGAVQYCHIFGCFVSLFGNQTTIQRKIFPSCGISKIVVCIAPIIICLFYCLFYDIIASIIAIINSGVELFKNFIVVAAINSASAMIVSAIYGRKIWWLNVLGFLLYMNIVVGGTSIVLTIGMKITGPIEYVLLISAGIGIAGFIVAVLLSLYCWKKGDKHTEFKKSKFIR